MAKKKILVFENGDTSEEQVSVARKTKVTWMADIDPNEITIEFADQVPFRKGVGEWPDNKKRKKGKEPGGTIRSDIPNGTRFTYQATGYGLQDENQPKGVPELIVEGGPGPHADDEPERPTIGKASKKARKTSKKRSGKTRTSTKSAGKATSRKKR